MVTKEQAMKESNFIQTKILTYPSLFNPTDFNTKDSDKLRKWQASGKCKTWKTRANEFKLPIKFGLYQSSYLTHENAYLFEVAK